MACFGQYLECYKLWDIASLDVHHILCAVERDFLSLAGKSDAKDKTEEPKGTPKMRFFATCSL